MYVFSFSEDEQEDGILESIITKLKTKFHELSTTMAPWAKDYPVDLNNTRINMEISKLYGQHSYQGTSNYTELFDDISDYGIRAHSVYPYRRKILVKGGLGTGKSVFAKKIIHDWANGTFRMYTVVSFIDMRSVEIGDPMGTVLVQQGGLSQEEVKHIFDKSTANSLLVMDGLDLSKNVKNILKFVKDLRANVLVTTSGVTDTGSLESYFDTVCSVKGFLGSEACRFLKSVEKTTKPDVLLNAKVSLPNIIDTPLETNPLLLIFMHILQENKILEQKSGSESTSANTITLCEIYFQLVKFLSRSLESDKFLTVLKQIGKLALGTLQNGTVLKSSDIPPNWYDIGLVVKGTGVAALFPHGSMQIFLGALYLVLTLEAEDGTTVESLIGSNCQTSLDDKFSFPVFLFNIGW